MTSHEWDAIVVGGGFYGCRLALHLRARFSRVLLLEKDHELLGRASLINQARIHQGYHYPRAILTAMRSRVNYEEFLSDYADCVVEDFDAYYAIARLNSKVTAGQFKTFCRRIAAPLEPAPKSIRRLFSQDLIEDVFRVREGAFDAVRLRDKLRRQLGASGVTVVHGAEALRILPQGQGRLAVEYRREGRTLTATAAHIFNCAYTRINRLLTASGAPPVPLKHEFTEMALVRLPPELERLAVTVMCGPFFSVVPFPSRGLHTLSHVRYTPRFAWEEGTGRARPPEIPSRQAPPPSYFPHMIKDAARYLPALGKTVYQESLWEVKTILPASELDDSRPILFLRDCGLKGLTCIMGGKIDNVYDMIKEVDHMLSAPEIRGAL